ncbi:helix-turn-helix transcriptional regulator [Salinisphaera japonica]|nr:WYL domain-containing protein [Salinisphaera japonica]
MTDTVFRQWTMLRHIPRAPQRVTTSALVTRLADEGFGVTPRTVERDLDKLATLFGYTCDTEGRTNHWYWPKNFGAVEIPGLEPNTALAFRLAEQHLSRLLPPATLDLLTPYFERARNVLDADSQKPLTHWQNKIRVIGHGPQLAAPTLDTDIQRTMYDALLHERRVTVDYAPRSDDAGRIKQYEFSPLGLVSRDGMLYLVGPLWEYDNVVQLALHRVKTLEPVDKSVYRPADFNLDDYIHAEGGFNYPTGEGTVELVLHANEATGAHLAERPISDDQTITGRANSVEIRASVLDTDALMWWLLGLGDGIEVLKPERLRRRIIDTLETTLAQYSPTTDAGENASNGS